MVCIWRSTPESDQFRGSTGMANGQLWVLRAQLIFKYGYHGYGLVTVIQTIIAVYILFTIWFVLNSIHFDLYKINSIVGLRFSICFLN